jgi:transcriptional regulator with XRE-family HTH domain
MILTATDFREARLKLGLTQRQLAPLLGYGKQQAVSDIETGLYAIRPQAALLLQAYLDGYRPRIGWPAKPGPERTGPKPKGQRDHSSPTPA